MASKKKRKDLEEDFDWEALPPVQAWTQLNVKVKPTPPKISKSILLKWEVEERIRPGDWMATSYNIHGEWELLDSHPSKKHLKRLYCHNHWPFVYLVHYKGGTHTKAKL